MRRRMGMMLVLLLGCAGEVVGGASWAATDDGNDLPEGCEINVEGELVCIESNPVPDCELDHGAGWVQVFDDGMFVGCACTDPFFCSDAPSSGGDGSGGGPSGGGGGGGTGTPSSAADEANRCFDFCAERRPPIQGCIQSGWRPMDGRCTHPSRTQPGRCAGTLELCGEWNQLPDGTEAWPSDWNCLEVSEDDAYRELCASYWQDCVAAWTAGAVGSGCVNHLDDLESSCRSRCMDQLVGDGTPCTSQLLDDDGNPSGPPRSGRVRGESCCTPRGPMESCSLCSAAGSVECEFHAGRPVPEGDRFQPVEPENALPSTPPSKLPPPRPAPTTRR